MMGRLSGRAPDHHPRPAHASTSRTRVPRQPLTRASSSYHGSSAARALSHVSKRRPSGCAKRSSAARWSAERPAYGSGSAGDATSSAPGRWEQHMSSTMHAARNGFAPPAVSAASIAARRIATRPPIEWPTSTTGPSTPAARHAAMTSRASASGLKSAGSPSADSPCPRRSRASAG